MTGRAMSRTELLTRWGSLLANAARSGALTGKPLPISRIETIKGPRAGALEIFAGLASGGLLRALARDGCANLRQFVPWSFVGDPQAFMAGRYVRVEAGWPTGLADSIIRLGDCDNYVSGKYANDGRWIAGKNENAKTVMPKLGDKTPHFLVSGATGSGKSKALQCAVLQLAQDDKNAIVLVDGKMGESLKPLERLPGVVGPCAVDGPQVRNALGWAACEMRRRYESGNRDGRVVVVIDEFQELVQDPVVVDLLRKLCAQGRAAGVHLLLATQHPTVAAFGDSSIRRNLVGKIALHVLDADASRVAVGGSNPRADYLLGAGDSYTIAPGNCHRVQLAFVDESDVTRIEEPGYSWIYSRWPDFDGGDVGQDLPDVAWKYTGAELAVSLVSASYSEGRPAMVRRLQDAELGKPGAERAIRLLKLGRDTNEWLGDNNFTVCLAGDAQSDGKNVKISPDVW